MFIEEDTKRALQALFFGLVAVITVTSSLRYFAYQYEDTKSVADGDIAAEASVQRAEGEAESVAPSQSQPASRGALVRQAFAATAPQVSNMPERQSDTYQLAIANYADHRLQFDNCVMVYPMISGTFKGGTELLIEGKSLDPQIIYFAGSEIALQGPDLALLRLPKVAKVTEYSIDCEMLDDRQYNVGRVTVYP